MQLQAIFSTDGQGWFLINASPDLRFQIEANRELQPSPSAGTRNTPIQSIILTSADLDQVLGLLLLREFQPLTIYATRLVRRVLEANSFFRMLQRVSRPVDLGRDCSRNVLSAWPVPLPARRLDFPVLCRSMHATWVWEKHREASIGLLLESGGLRIAYTPSLPEITEELLAIYRSCDAILVDGTFWSDAELSNNHAGTPLARAIGHIPMSGEDGTIALLAGITRPKKIFIHLNNTNPVLDPRSAEYKQVIDAGWEIGHDGWQLN